MDKREREGPASSEDALIADIEAWRCDAAPAAPTEGEIEAACVDLRRFLGSNKGADMLDSLSRALFSCEDERNVLKKALHEIERRLESAAAEVDCFNVYESLALARAALAASVRAKHAIITDVCRANRTDVGAVDEALLRLRDEAVDLMMRRPSGLGDKFHFILSLEFGEEK